LLRLLAEDGLKIVGEARNGEEAVRRALELRPDVIVMDVNMPGMSGVEATRELQTAAPECAVLMLTVNADDDDVLDAILAGAAGYLLKDARLPEIVRAIHAAAAGEALIAPAVTAGVFDRLRSHGAPDAPRAPVVALSPRELDVLRLIVAGHDNGEIGRQLHLSASTIKHHASSILDKLGVQNRIQAAVLAVRSGLVEE
jgi:DNA-binding NarL/FixJ family response regulator